MNNIICVKLFYNKRLRKNLIFLIINSIVFSSFMDTIFFNLISMEKYMENKQLKNKISEVLKADVRLWNDNKTELNQTLLLDLVENIDENVIELLLGEESLRDKFFVKIKNIYVFKTNDFKFFMEEHKIDNSYTQYKNRIGLTDGKKFLKDTNDVVLDFPYKDCILMGGQSNEEGFDTYFAYEEEKSKIVQGEKITEPSGYKEKQSKRKEVFFNQVLAQDEIDRLFDEKALVNWSRFTQNGKVNVGDIKKDENGIIKENLIIKGNNLLALHSLKSKFKGQVKLIYIDPPYNTGNDGFKYNDNFNHSTWLTFMKNRLEIAKELLKEDGLIFISIDDREHSYLKILCDSIFDKDNFISDIIIQVNKGGRDYLKIAKTHEFILCYQKSDSAEINEIEKEGLVFRYSDKHGNYNLRELRNRNPKFNKINRPNLYYSFYIDESSIDENGLCNVSLEEKDEFKTITYPLNSQGQESCWRWGKTKSIQNITSDIYTTQVVAKQKSDGNWNVYEKHRKSKGKIKSVWDDSDVRTEAGTKELGKIIGKDEFAFPKPIELIKRVIQLSTNKEDIILDFHAGSGTTAHAVLELNKKDDGNRKFIMVEQMDYINTVTNARVQKVIQKENIDDSFIYFELAQWNEQAKKEINACKNLDGLEKLFDTLYEKYFLNYNFKVKEFKEKVINEDEFKALSLEEQKRMFLSMLDLNQMYVQKTEMEDKRFGINDEDQKLTNEFYKNEK